ncbi:MAG: D-glycerate dehydrogenase [Chloroflexota bacterium]
MSETHDSTILYYRARDEVKINELPYFFGWVEIEDQKIVGEHYKPKQDPQNSDYSIGYYKIEGSEQDFQNNFDKDALVEISQEDFNAILSKWTRGGEYTPLNWGQGWPTEIAQTDADEPTVTKKVFITRQVPQKGLDLILADPSVDIELWPGEFPPSREQLLEKVRGIDGLYCLLTETIDDEVLEAAGPQLKVVSQMAVGYDNIDVEACTRRGIAVGNTPGVLTEATADLAMALLLGTARQLVSAAEAVKAGKWQTWEPMGHTGPDVYGSTVGLIGMGRIGLAMARRLQGFNVKLLYHNRTSSEEAEAVGAIYVDLDTLLAESDFVSLHMPFTPETKHLINAERLKQMKPTATLINTARGGVVDQDALIEALRDGTIAYAGLDVTTPEPLPADSPLLQLPNATVLPHIGSASGPAREKMATMAAENLLAGINSKLLPTCVNPQVYK